MLVGKILAVSGGFQSLRKLFSSMREIVETELSAEMID
jgi:hypothetical protein